MAIFTRLVFQDTLENINRLEDGHLIDEQRRGACGSTDVPRRSFSMVSMAVNPTLLKQGEAFTSALLANWGGCREAVRHVTICEIQVLKRPNVHFSICKLEILNIGQ